MKFKDYIKTHLIDEGTEVYVSVLCCLEKPETRIFREIKPTITQLHHSRSTYEDYWWVYDKKGISCSAEWVAYGKEYCIYISDTYEEAVKDYLTQIDDALNLRQQQLDNYTNKMKGVISKLNDHKIGYNVK